MELDARLLITLGGMFISVVTSFVVTRQKCIELEDLSKTMQKNIAELYDNLEKNKVRSRTLVNARIGYAFNENLRLSLIGRNIFDEDYYTFLNREPTTGFARLGDPRVVSLRLDADF